MSKVTLELKDFKVLASETRLDILRVLDGKRMGLKEISEATHLAEMTVHEHMAKLVEGGFVHKDEREGYKWVYYKLSWKGASLLHPENTHIVILFSSTFIAFFLSLISFFLLYQERFLMVGASQPGGNIPEKIFQRSSPLEYSVLFCIVLFITLLSASIWRWRKNKTPKL
jgi:DNA-binding transcriptional ArsR family regulator